MKLKHIDDLAENPSEFWQAWHRMLTPLGIAYIRFHDLRHTMATAMVLAGVHPKIVPERLGHASIATTLDIYSLVSPGGQQTAESKLDSIFSMRSGSKHQIQGIPLLT